MIVNVFVYMNINDKRHGASNTTSKTKGIGRDWEREWEKLKKSGRQKRRSKEIERENDIKGLWKREAGKKREREDDRKGEQN